MLYPLSNLAGAEINLYMVVRSQISLDGVKCPLGIESSPAENHQSRTTLLNEFFKISKTMWETFQLETLLKV